MSEVSTLYPLFGAVLIAIAAPLGSFLVARRQTRGEIVTSAAAELWQENRALKEQMRSEIEDLRAEVERVRQELTSLHRENWRLRGENQRLEHEVEIVRSENARLSQRVTELEGRR